MTSQTARLGLVLALVLGAGGVGRARAGEETGARTPAETYERGRDLPDVLRYVVGDLGVRAAAAPEAPPPVLSLLLEASSSTSRALEVLGRALPTVAAQGPPGLRIGVATVTGERLEPTPEPDRAAGALLAHATLPAAGGHNVLAALREHVRTLDAGGGPVSVVLVAEAGGESEDDVEATRSVLLDTGAAFYALAPEAAFERAWDLSFSPRALEEGAVAERFQPGTERGEDPTHYRGGDVAYGLVPYLWELDLAQLEFVWKRPPRYPVPSGFGHWALASLAWTTGGRYFVTDFRAVGAGAKSIPEKPLYDPGRLALYAPDLRPRERVLRDLSRDPRAKAVVKIWEHLADESSPVIGMRGTVELRGGALVERPTRPVRSRQPLAVWYEDMGDVRKAIGFARGRLDRLDLAMRWWTSANAKPTSGGEGADPLHERIEADFQLLGVLLRQAQFHWMERLAALERIKPLHVSLRRVRLVPKVLAVGLDRRPEARDVGDRERNLALAELWLMRSRLAAKYASTPWALLLSRQSTYTYELLVEVLEEPEPVPRPRPGAGQTPAPPKPTPPRPAAGPRPGSTSGGPATGK